MPPVPPTPLRSSSAATLLSALFRSRLLGAGLLGSLAALTLAAAGCGGGAGSGTTSATASLARFAPADSVAFGQVAVRPEGSLKDSIESILGRFPNGNSVGEKLVEDLDQSLAKDGLSYEDNIEPWLGQHLGGFVTKLSFDPQGEPRVTSAQAAVVVETTDESRARQEALSSARKDGPVRTDSYKGVQIFDQHAGKDPGAFAVFDGVAVISEAEAGVREAIDASKGDNLSSNAGLNSFLADREGDNMAVGYLDSGAILDSLKRSGAISAQLLDSLQRTYGLGADKPVLAALDVTDSKVTLELASSAPSGGGAAGESSLIDSIPDDAWAALGLTDVGGYVNRLARQLDWAGVPGFSVGTLNRFLSRRAGISLEDLKSLGDAAMFASGTDIFGIEVGAVVQVSSASARNHLMAAMRRAARRSRNVRVSSLGVSGAQGFSVIPSGFPAPIDFATEGDKLVVAVGDNATESLLHGGGGSSAVDSAREALGGGDFAVDFLLRVQPVLELVDNVGGGNYPEFQRARRYLDPISTIAAGTRTEGDERLVRIVVELSG